MKIDRTFILFLFVSSLAYVLQNLAFPIHEGRDVGTYWLYFRDIWVSDPEYPIVMLFRTPVSSVLFGMLFLTKQWWIVTGYFYLSYLVIQFCLFKIAANWGQLTAWIVLFLTSISGEFFQVFNSVASENPTAVLFTSFVLFVFSIRSTNKLLPWAWVGVFAAILVLIRPNHQVFILIPLLALLNRRLVLRARIQQVLVGSGVFVLLLLSYCSYNFVRYDKFEIAHLGPAHMPFYRLFIHEKMIRPEFGPASAELGDIVREDVLTRKVFLDHDIDEDLFWRAATPRFWIHIVDALNQRYGYLDNNSLLSKVSWEAHAANPLVFWFSYWDSWSRFFELPERTDLRPHSRVYSNFDQLLGERYSYYRRIGIPQPNEDDLIPGVLSQLNYQPAEFSHSIREDFDPWIIPRGKSIHVLQRIIYVLGFLRPSVSTMLLFMILGMISGGWKDSGYLFLFFLTLIVVLMLSATLMANPEPQFRYPFDPFFITSGIVGLSVLFNRFFLVRYNKGHGRERLQV